MNIDSSKGSVVSALYGQKTIDLPKTPSPIEIPQTPKNRAPIDIPQTITKSENLPANLGKNINLAA